MAQVKKLQGGGTPANPVDLFEWEGVGKYERKPMVQTLTKNLTAYADYLGLSGDRRTRFLDNGARAIKALESGHLRRLANGSYEDASGVMSSTGKYDKNWLGRLRDTDNNAYNDIAGYFDTYMSKASVYDPDKAKKEAEEKAKKDKTKFSGDTFLQSGLAQKYYAGNFNTTDWFDHRDDKSRYNAIADYLDSVDYNAIYNKYLWDDSGIDSADDLKSRATVFTQNLRQGELDNSDYNTAAALGINLDTFLKKPEQTPKEPTKDEQEASAKKAFIKEQTDAGKTPEQAEQLWNNQQTIQSYQAQADVDASNAQVADLNNNKAFEDWYAAHNSPAQGQSYRLRGNASYDEGKMQGVMGGKSAKDYFSTALSTDILTLKKQQYANDKAKSIRHILNNLDYGVKSGYFVDLGDGNYLIPHTFNANTYTGYVYNPSAKTYQYTSLLANKNWKNFVKSYYYNSKGWTLPTSNKYGGTLKLQGGGDFFQANYDAANRYTNEVAAQRKQVETQKQIEKAESKGRTAEQQAYMDTKVGTPGNAKFSAMDKWRLANAGADILSMISAYVPVYGTAASAITGVGSTFSNLGADIAEDGFQWSDLGNFGLSLGMDAMGLIPGLGSSSKVGKIVKTLKTVIPTALLIWQASKADGAYEAGKKLMKSPDSMTREDWLELSNGIKLLLGGSNLAAGKIHSYNASKGKIATGKAYSFKTANGKKATLNEHQYSQVLAAGKGKKGKELLAAQNEKLKELLGDNVAITQPFRDGIRYIGRQTKAKETTLYERPDYTEIGWKPWNIGADNKPKSFSNYAIYDWTANIGSGARSLDLFSNSHIGQSRVKPATKPASSLTTSPSPQPAAPKRRIIRPLDDYGTREKVQYIKKKNGRPVATISHIIRKGELTDAEIKQINNNRIAAGKQPLTQKEIDAINARAANNTATTPGLRERVMQSERYQRRALEQDLARARQEIAEADALAAQKRNNRLPVLSTNFTKTGSGPVQSPPRPNRTKMSPSGHTITNPARMLPAPRRIKLITKPAPVTAQSINQQFGLITPNGAIPMGPSRASRQADLEAVFGRSAIAKKAAKTRAKNKAAKKAEAPKRKAEFLERQRQREEKRAKRYAAAKARRQSKKLEETLADNLDHLKSGGRLVPRFKNPSGPISNTKSTANWLTDVYGTAAMSTWLGSYNKDNYKEFNELQRQYYDNLKATGFDPSKTTRVQYNQGVYDRQGKFNTAAPGINGVIESLAGPNGKITRAGTTGDNAKGKFQDGFFGFQEYLRHGGMNTSGLTKEQLAAINKLVGANDLEYYFDPTTGMAMLRPKVDVALNTKADVPSPGSQVPKITTTARAVNRDTKGNKSGTGWNLLPEDVLAASRMIMGLGANARAAKQTKAGMRPLLTDTWENVVSPEWDYFAQRTGEDAYARLTSFAARPRTANSQDQFAGQLEAENKGNQFIAQGNQQAANRFYQTDRLRQQESDAAKARRVENANANTGRMLSVDAAKHQIDAALTTAQYAQVLAPWMAGIENQYRQNRAIQRQMDASAYQRALLAQMQADYDAAVKAGDQKKVKEITDKYYTALAAYNKRAYSSPWLIQRTTQLPASSSYNWIDYAKQGGRLTAREREVIQRARDFNKRMLADNKQFHRDIMESKREHNKLIAGMSNLTADLIKNGMKWK